MSVIICYHWCITKC